MYTICYYFLLFFIYSVLGWIMESTLTSISHKKFINRGFLIGPYCPIYGYGSIIMTLTLTQYKNDVFVLFGMSMLICSTLEYFTSWIMEKLFRARWWDYSKQPFNLEGRICLKNSILFGIGGIFVVVFINPFLTSSLDMLSHNVLMIISICFFVIFAIDTFISYFTINRLKNTITSILREDSTIEISNKVKETIKNQTFLLRRLLSAFPTIKFEPLKNFQKKMKQKSK